MTELMESKLRQWAVENCYRDMFEPNCTSYLTFEGKLDGYGGDDLVPTHHRGLCKAVLTVVRNRKLGLIFEAAR